MCGSDDDLALESREVLCGPLAKQVEHPWSRGPVGSTFLSTALVFCLYNYSIRSESHSKAIVHIILYYPVRVTYYLLVPVVNHSTLFSVSQIH